MHIWSPSISSMLFLLFCKGTRNDCNPSNYGLLASCLSYEQLQQEINRQFGFGKIFCCRMKWDSSFVLPHCNNKKQSAKQGWNLLNLIEWTNVGHLSA